MPFGSLKYKKNKDKNMEKIKKIYITIGIKVFLPTNRSSSLVSIKGLNDETLTTESDDWLAFLNFFSTSTSIMTEIWFESLIGGFHKVES